MKLNTLTNSTTYNNNKNLILQLSIKNPTFTQNAQTTCIQLTFAPLVCRK